MATVGAKLPGDVTDQGRTSSRRRIEQGCCVAPASLASAMSLKVFLELPGVTPLGRNLARSARPSMIRLLQINVTRTVGTR